MTLTKKEETTPDCPATMPRGPGTTPLSRTRLPTTASIARAPESAELLQKTEDLSSQVATLSSGRTRHRPHSRDRRKANDVPPTAPRIAVTVGTTGDTGTRRKGVLHRAPSANRKTAATCVDGGRRLFHTPPAHHQQEHKQHTAFLRTIGCTGKLTRLQPHRTSPRFSGQ